VPAAWQRLSMIADAQAVVVVNIEEDLQVADESEGGG
jgi:hypothetical protein